jgi:hypothetical protein
MTNDIDVVMYSYKGKLLKDVVGSIFANSSGTRNINLMLIDQNPIVRENLFAAFPNLTYTHIFWDSQKSPLTHKKDIINRSSAQYILILGDNVLLNKNWDEELVSFINSKNIVISGNKNISISQESLFYLTKTFEDSEDFNLTNFIDKDFIFLNRDTFEEFEYPSYLKHNGEMEALSLNIFTSGVDIYCSPSNIFSKVGSSTIEELYVPFSINHNYNEIINLLHHGSNSFISLLDKPRSVLDFITFHGIDPSMINKLPFQTNDVEYDPADMNFNSVDARRFVARTKAIH